MRIAETAVERFGSIDVLVNNAGIFFTKAFTDYTAEDFRSLVSTNLEGFLYITQLAIKQMLAQKSGGSIVTITASLVDNPIAGHQRRGPHDHQGRLERGDPQPGDGVREGRHPRERGRAGRRGYPAPQEKPEGLLEDVVADGPDLGRAGDRRCGALLTEAPG